MNALSGIALTMIAGFPLVVWLGIATILLLITTGSYGILLFKGKIRGSIRQHMTLGLTTATVALIHAIFAISIFI